MSIFGQAKPLTWMRQWPYCFWASRPGDRWCQIRKVAPEESPGSMETRCRITSGWGNGPEETPVANPRESATENKPPTGSPAARVKWWGKSPPRLWQHKWQGKPHREQDQIGMVREQFQPVSRPAIRVGCVEAFGNECPR